ncbi:MAG: DoxX family protein [Bacteroidales bacterium]|jgi:uncharacterized membrane protein YphA (DoxX/SURF4 family)|nr:DoxX family protein [Bacteroidales bacterium]
MKIIRTICRILIGLTFVISGFLKGVDPAGFSLKISEYLAAFHLSFLSFSSIFIAIAILSAEFVIGISILKGLKMRVTSFAALVFAGFFTLITFYSAIFNPVSDCGCFGDAVHLTNWESFFKNIVLLTCAILLFLKRKDFIPFCSQKIEVIYLLCYSAFIVGLSVYSAVYLPPVDFGPFRPGAVINSSSYLPVRSYKSTLIYSKDGHEKEFTIKNIPDSTWTYVETKTSLSGGAGNYDNSSVLSLSDSSGMYVTDSILDSDKPVLMIIRHSLKPLSEKNIREIGKLYAASLANNTEFFIINNTTDIIPKGFSNGIPSLSMDHKTALSLCRSDGGLVYINGKTIIEKWPRGKYPVDSFTKVISSDPEILSARTIIKERIFIETSIAVVLLLVVLIRFVSRYRFL